MVTRFRRYGQIADVLVKYGFGIVLQDVFPGLQRFRFSRKITENDKQTVYERVRMAIEELGPTFIKFGQIMSTRKELLPPPLIVELQKLTDHARPLPFSEIKPVLLDACPDLDEWFMVIEEQPVASASIAQVHRAVLRDGTPVALKVQRPGIAEKIETDIPILISLATRLEHAVPDARLYNPSGMVKDFAAQIRKELDFNHDGRTSERFARNFVGVPGIKFPKIYWEYSSPHLLVMEFIDGVRIDDVDEIVRMGYDPKAIAARGFRAYLKMIFEDGYFHGDPHAGNLLVTMSGDLAFLDFGIVGVLRPEKRQVFINLIYGVMTEDIDMILKAFEGMGIVIREDDRESLRDDIYLMLQDYGNVTAGQVNFKLIIGEITEILRRDKIQVPMNLMLMFKVLAMIMDTGTRIDPEFDAGNELKPFVMELVTKENFSAQMMKRASGSMLEAVDAAFDMPRNVNLMLKKLSTGTIRLEIVEDDLKKLRQSVDSASDKVLIGLIIASLVVGSSLILMSSRIELPFQVFYLAIFGYSVAVLIGFYTLYNVLFSRFKDF
ncbi:MAG: AarF/ABC1/UbiB kinase family protein [Methanoregulaceae archaeon]